MPIYRPSSWLGWGARPVTIAVRLRRLPREVIVQGGLVGVGRQHVICSGGTTMRQVTTATSLIYSSMEREQRAPREASVDMGHTEVSSDQLVKIFAIVTFDGDCGWHSVANFQPGRGSNQPSAHGRSILYLSVLAPLFSAFVLLCPHKSTQGHIGQNHPCLQYS